MGNSFKILNNFQNPASPTGWMITQLGGLEPGSEGKKPFSMCHVGLLWCAIESVVEWGKHMNNDVNLDDYN